MAFWGVLTLSVTDRTIRRPIDEHWKSQAVAVMDRYRETDPQGWADYLAEAEALAGADSPVAD